mmetsp:Transcript_14805/g.36173  ORF Transcript_14805/g.36173 Transcript_14805/m.36173 type:complete len:85 (+) Transcript_14805:1899-2153(+)
MKKRTPQSTVKSLTTDFFNILTKKTKKQSKKKTRMVQAGITERMVYTVRSCDPSHRVVGYRLKFGNRNSAKPHQMHAMYRFVNE